MPAKKPRLSNTRNFLKKMPQLAFRGTTLDHIPQEIHYGKKRVEGIPHFFITTEDLFHGKTRNIVHRLYSTVAESMNSAFHYSGAKIGFENHSLTVSKPSKTPVVLLVVNPRKGKGAHVESWNFPEERRAFSTTNIATVKKAKDNRILNVTEIPQFGKNAKVLPIEISEKDFADANKAWEAYRQKNIELFSKGYAEGHSAINFAYNFLIRRVTQKALPLIRQNAMFGRAVRKKP
ncbi:MAG: hypothetical protein Q7R70_03285 [Candidatus Diapherotrites archaeon]|nr:hypothetical protein [Candidatus Diapherotrites archaeon]